MRELTRLKYTILADATVRGAETEGWVAVLLIGDPPVRGCGPSCRPPTPVLTRE